MVNTLLRTRIPNQILLSVVCCCASYDSLLLHLLILSTPMFICERKINVHFWFLRTNVYYSRFVYQSYKTFLFIFFITVNLYASQKGFISRVHLLYNQICILIVLLICNLNYLYKGKYKYRYQEIEIAPL